MTSSVTAPLERQFGQMPGLSQMSSTSSAGASVITLQFDLELGLDVAEQEVQAAINAAGNLLPARPAGAADLRQGQPGRRADPDARRHVEDDAADRRCRISPTRASRRRSRRSRAWAWSRCAAGSARRCACRRTCAALAALRAQPRRPAHDARQPQRQHAEGQLRRADARLHDQRQRPARERRGLRTTRSSRTATARRCCCPTWRDVVEGAENTGSAAWMDDTPAIILNIQRQPGANVIEVVDRIKALAAAAAGGAAGRHRRRRRSPTAPSTIRASVHDVAVRAGARGRARGAVIFVFLRSAAGDPDPEPVGAAVARRHVRRHVPAAASASTT